MEECAIITHNNKQLVLLNTETGRFEIIDAKNGAFELGKRSLIVTGTYPKLSPISPISSINIREFKGSEKKLITIDGQLSCMSRETWSKMQKSLRWLSDEYEVIVQHFIVK